MISYTSNCTISSSRAIPHIALCDILRLCHVAPLLNNQLRKKSLSFTYSEENVGFKGSHTGNIPNHYNLIYYISCLEISKLYICLDKALRRMACNVTLTFIRVFCIYPPRLYRICKYAPVVSVFTYTPLPFLFNTFCISELTSQSDHQNICDDFFLLK